ncbi:ABC transporter substrate-binding protein [Sneathiella sp.]|uniref:ABC transporter substrate-binding protein n=1 Tax=Sneathiella sp. TaxID=1964365 RepID=UPI002FE0DA37
MRLLPTITSLLVAAVAVPLLAVPAKAETTLNAVVHAPLRALDPSVSTARITRTHGFMVFDTLLGLDDDLMVQPQMASYTTSDDKLTYTFTLRDGLKWHDGAPVTAADCVASLERWGKFDGAGRKMMEYVSSIEAVSDNSFVIKLETAFGPLPDLLAKPSPIPAFMMPKRLAELPEGEQIKDMIGSGPFKFVADEFQPGVRAVYVKNEDYIPRDEPASGSAGGKVVKVDRVVWNVMPDTQTTLNALMSGDVDIVENVPIDLLPLLETDSDIVVGDTKPVGSQLTGQFNHTQPPFSDVNIRRAAMYALDQEQLLATAIGNPDYYTLCASSYGCTVPLASDAGHEYLDGPAEERMEKAKKLLAEAGYDGTPILMMQPTDLASLNSQPIVAAERLREAGFKVDVVPMDWASLQARKDSQNAVADGGWNMFFTFWGVEGIWNPLANPLIDGTGDANAWAGWRISPEVEALRGQYIASTDLEEQKKIAREIQQIAYDQAFYFNGGEFRGASAWRSNVDGIVPGMVLQFWNITKD